MYSSKKAQTGLGTNDKTTQKLNCEQNHSWECNSQCSSSSSPKATTTPDLISAHNSLNIHPLINNLHKQHQLSPTGSVHTSTHLQDEHVLLVVIPEPVVLHVVPEQLEGLLLFPALQGRRRRRGGGRGGGREEGSATGHQSSKREMKIL